MTSISATTALRRACVWAALAAASLATLGAASTHAADPTLVCDASVQVSLVSMSPDLYVGDTGSGSTTVDKGSYSVHVDWTVDLSGSSRSVDVALTLTGTGYYLQHTLVWYLVPSSEVTDPPTYGGLVSWSDDYGPVTTRTTNFDFTNNTQFQGVYAISALVAQCLPTTESSVPSSTEVDNPTSSSTPSTEADIVTSESGAGFPQTGSGNGALAAIALLVVVAGSLSIVLSRRSSTS